MLKVLVTGSSSGFGERIARTLAIGGQHVFASMREVRTRNASVARELEDWAAQAGLRLDVVELDVTSDASVQSAIGRILELAGHIDVLVSNAGVAASGPLEAFSMAQIQALFDLNAFGPIRVSKAVLPAMRARQAGLLVFVTSTLGRILPGSGGLYPATKWALEGLAESLHYQVAAFGVDVTILEPGSFPTPALSKAMPAADAQIAAAYAAVTPGRPSPAAPPADYRLPDPQEVADAVAALIALPAGQRPLRTVVGHVFTEGVAEYNAAYERARARLIEALRRPDQAILWGTRR